jgi:hypothetical protein
LRAAFRCAAGISPIYAARERFCASLSYSTGDARTGSLPAETDPLKPDRTTRPIIQGTTAMITTNVPRRTRSNLVRALFAGVAAAALSSSFGTLAMAEDAHVNSMTFDVSSPYQMAIVKVTSSDGKKWDTILPGTVGFHASMQIDTRSPGYVERVGIFLGKCTNTGCANHQRVFVHWAAVRDYNESRNVTFPVEKLKAGAPGIFGQTYGETILAECNKGLQPDGATKPHTKLIAPDVSLSVNTRKSVLSPPPGEVFENPEDVPFNGGDHTRHGAFLVQLDCQATAKTAAPPKNDPQRTKPVATKDLDLFLTTYKVPETGPRGTTCKPLKVTTRISTDKEGLVNVKLWRQVNGGPITSETKAMHAEVLGGAKFGDDWNKIEQFSKTTTVQYKAEVLGGTFAPSTPWKSVTIHCNGDFAPTPSNSNPDGHIPPRGTPQAELPPVIVTPPPLCGTKAAKVRGAAPCIKTAPLPDQRQHWADQKRKQAAEEKRKAAKEAEQRRREAAAKNAELLRRQQMMQQRPVMHRPVGLSRPMGPARAHFQPGIMFRR